MEYLLNCVMLHRQLQILTYDVGIFNFLLHALRVFYVDYSYVSLDTNIKRLIRFRSVSREPTSCAPLPTLIRRTMSKCP